jgi:hypothetical protein
VSNPLSRLFLDHPREVGESYVEHFVASAGYGLRVLKVAGFCFVHALVPGLYKTKASDTIRRMASELGGRAVVAREERMRQAGVWDPGL